MTKSTLCWNIESSWLGPAPAGLEPHNWNVQKCHHSTASSTVHHLAGAGHCYQLGRNRPAFCSAGDPNARRRYDSCSYYIINLPSQDIYFLNLQLQPGQLGTSRRNRKLDIWLPWKTSFFGWWTTGTTNSGQPSSGPPGTRRPGTQRSMGSGTGVCPVRPHTEINFGSTLMRQL